VSAGARRIKVQGDLYHGHVPEGAVYVGRAAPGLAGSRFANPHKAKGLGRDEAIRLYREHLAAHPELVAAARSELAGKALACWCAPDQACHADVLLELVAARPGED
jgi:hypothetical protein